MATEIERKFLVDTEKFGKITPEKSIAITQGYIPRGNDVVVRVRVTDDTAFLTIKGPNHGISRTEFEYVIPVEDAVEMLKLCDRRVVDKVRNIVDFDGHIWEVDEFRGDNLGLVVAEVELQSEDEKVSLPNWIIEEVTDDKKYYNSNLMENPFKDWQ